MKTILLFLFTISFALGQDIMPVDSSGYMLRDFYLSLNVENLWTAGHHINWETGEPDDPGSKHEHKTHCSAFVAAACKRLNLYILRPPEHSQKLLANAQFEWLGSDEGLNKGWIQISDSNLFNVYLTAQQMANKGMVVVSVCENPDPSESGHSALVLPGEISKDSVYENGPLIIMAGTNNYNSVSLRKGFQRHIEEWPEKAIRFYYNKAIL